MKRIVLIGTAVAGIFTAGITSVATAATTHRKTTTVTTVKRVTTTVRVHAKCKLALTVVAPAGSTGVTPGSESGDQWGASRCSGLSSGATHVAYTTDTSGDLTGTLQHWMNGGGLSGTFTLSPSQSSGPPTTTSFTSAGYTGTVKLTRATGLLKGTTGSGTLTCTTRDSVHYACIEHLRLAQPQTKLVTVHRKVTVA